MAKLHYNSVLSTPDGKYLIVDVKNFYLKNPMNKAENYNIALKIMPQYIIDKYYLINKQCDGYLYVQIEKGIYGLVQSGIIAHKAIKEHIQPYGCAPAKITQGLWAHKYRDIHFTIMVDDLGIRYRNKKYTDHLISALQSKYEVTQYWVTSYWG